jgi:hypothetical protein
MKNKKQENSEKKISLNEMIDKIRERAMEICLERGDKPGDALSDWLLAEKEIEEKFEVI